MELPLLGVLSRMERRGVLIDSDALFQHNLMKSLNRLSELEEQAYVLAGQPFNLASTKQLQEILFDKLGLPVIQKHQKVHHPLTRKCWRNSHLVMNCRKCW